MLVSQRKAPLIPEIHHLMMQTQVEAFMSAPQILLSSRGRDLCLHYNLYDLRAEHTAILRGCFALGVFKLKIKAAATSICFLSTMHITHRNG